MATACKRFGPMTEVLVRDGEAEKTSNKVNRTNQPPGRSTAATGARERTEDAQPHTPQQQTRKKRNTRDGSKAHGSAKANCVNVTVRQSPHEESHRLVNCDLRRPLAGSAPQPSRPSAKHETLAVNEVRPQPHQCHLPTFAHYNMRLSLL